MANREQQQKNANRDDAARRQAGDQDITDLQPGQQRPRLPGTPASRGVIGETSTREPFEQKQAGDKPEYQEELQGKSKVYCDKFSDVMRKFNTGQLHSKFSNSIVTDPAEAKLLAREQARKADEHSRP